MTAARWQIIAAAEARLAAIAGIACIEINPSGDPDAYPALGLHDRGHRVIEGEAGATRYVLTLMVDGFVQGEGVDGATLSALYADVVTALVTETPFEELPGAVENVDEVDTDVEIAELASERRLGFATSFEIQFSTPRGDPSRFA
ncbi:hypothetical protein [Sphingomonas solaris]|uniref:DUF3168 domain-containing protein n=1 Tax=Alterirhizorhabdus solaris TaxID=2529389 RepID=A0A558R828_9SPHN|nr:hypothetical protein [Sphingomonas solaris]TVV75549.1 hypothetical protein FOY91_06725 [Sphingomonas solaris]